MKKSVLLSSIALPFFLLSSGNVSAQADLVPGINYSYNPPGSDGIIHAITVDVCENNGVAAGSFDVAMYLYDQSTTNYWVIGTTTVNSLSASSCVTISNWDIDINNTSGIPGGTYRLGIWVDSNNDISESDDNNNTGLLSGNINYSPTGIIDHSAGKVTTALGQAFPNPASTEVKFHFSLAEAGKTSLKVYDMTGREIKSLVDDQLDAGNYTYGLDVSQMPQGIYLYTLTAGNTVMTRRLTVTR